VLRRRLEAADRAPSTPSATSGPPISGFVPIFQTVSLGTWVHKEMKKGQSL